MVIECLIEGLTILDVQKIGPAFIEIILLNLVGAIQIVTPSPHRCLTLIPLKERTYYLNE